jgi:hypothetical protein
MNKKEEIAVDKTGGELDAAVIMCRLLETVCADSLKNVEGDEYPYRVTHALRHALGVARHLHRALDTASLRLYTLIEMHHGGAVEIGEELPRADRMALGFSS